MKVDSSTTEKIRPVYLSKYPQISGCCSAEDSGQALRSITGQKRCEIEQNVTSFFFSQSRKLFYLSHAFWNSQKLVTNSYRKNYNVMCYTIQEHFTLFCKIPFWPCHLSHSVELHFYCQATLSASQENTVFTGSCPLCSFWGYNTTFQCQEKRVNG